MRGRSGYLEWLLANSDGKFPSPDYQDWIDTNYRTALTKEEAIYGSLWRNKELDDVLYKLKGRRDGLAALISDIEAGQNEERDEVVADLRRRHRAVEEEMDKVVADAMRRPESLIVKEEMSKNFADRIADAVRLKKPQPDRE